MDPATFIATMTQALAWPAATVTIFLLVRRALVARIPDLERMKFKDFELQFQRRVAEVADRVAVALPPPDRASTQPTPTQGGILELSKISPRAAVLEAWRDVEIAAMEGALREGISLTDGSTRSPSQVIHKLKEAGKVDQKHVELFEELRRLRNDAAHAPNFALGVESAVKYAATADDLGRFLSQGPP